MTSPTNGGSTGAAQAQPNFNVITQYIKDFSFENPNAPKSLMQSQQQPQITIQVNVSTNQLSNTDFEVSLKVEGKAELTGTALFRGELIASTISNGGFSPLLLQPIDFVALYQRRLANMQAQQPAVQA